jgi:hypothetical protein
MRKSATAGVWNDVASYLEEEPNARALARRIRANTSGFDGYEDVKITLTDAEWGALQDVIGQCSYEGEFEDA